jgi:hypothetical protein
MENAIIVYVRLLVKIQKESRDRNSAKANTVLFRKDDALKYTYPSRFAVVLPWGDGFMFSRFLSR